MKRKFVQIAALCLSAVLLSLCAGGQRAAAAPTGGDGRIIRVGLHFGTGAMEGLNFANTTGVGYRFGYYDGANQFVPLGSTGQKAISVVKTMNVYYGTFSGYTSYHSALTTANVAVGEYHLQLPGSYSSFAEAQAAASAYAGGFPAYIGGTFYARVGNYTARAGAETAQAALAAQGVETVIKGTSEYGVSVVITGTNTILFQFDDLGQGTGMGMEPNAEGPGEYVTLSKGCTYVGGFRFERVNGGSLTVVNILDFEDYIKGVVPHEMSNSWPIEALKAQAVAARSYALSLGDKQANYQGEDFREGMTAVLIVKMQNVQFEGQTKTKLGNPEAKNMVENLLTDALKDYFNKVKKDVTDAIFGKAAVACKARENASKAKEVARKMKGMSNSELVGKLAGCSGRKAELNELFIVEGDSAGGSAKQGRDRSVQAILPLKGKPLNTEKKSKNGIVDNEELMSLINALGTGFDKDFDIKGLKYNKVIILADADQDGAHIRSILLTFFFRYMRQLIIDGHVYIGMPPLYKITEKNVVKYAYDDNELTEMLKDCGKNYTLQRYKGLGEMNPEQLWETTLNPATRTLMRVTIEDAATADKLIDTLMGADVEPRKQYIYEYADFNKVDKFKEFSAK